MVGSLYHLEDCPQLIFYSVWGLIPALDLSRNMTLKNATPMDLRTDQLQSTLVCFDDSNGLKMCHMELKF